jgi:putative colanic acid biosynthesis glycosyltransferase
VFSIITITYNNIIGLKKTHQSIIQQTTNNYRWIVIDGGSSDATLDYLKSTNTTYISEADNGIYNAMNKGIKLSKEPYILFLNAGDCFAKKDSLETLENLIKKDRPDFIYGDSIEEKTNQFNYKKARHHSKINQGMFTHHQSMIYKADLFETNNYNEKYIIAADYDLTLRALKKSLIISYLPQPICIFEAGGLSQQKIIQGRIEQFLIRKEFGISIYKNTAIFIGQTFIFYLRRFAPRLYWFLKRG